MPQPVTSPDLTVLDFGILYDISGAIPVITLTNRSVGNPSGTTGLNLCTWWYVITTPSGAPIHTGSVTAPDVTAANWATLSTTPNSWPTPFGTPPCGQVEFSCAVPYVCTLYVKDAANTIFSYSKSTVICRPGGSNNNTCGSFGGADAVVTVQCQSAKIYAQDATNYTYQNQLGTQQSSVWTLRYPADASGVPPANGTAENTPYVYFDIGYSGEGYTLYLQTFAVYDLGNGCSVKIQYKLLADSGVGTGKTFAVWCNVDLCALDCEMQKFYELVKKSCGEVESPDLERKAIQVNLLYNRLLTGILQPLCNIDVPGIIRQIEKLGGFACDCCCGGGINVGNPVPPANGNGGCCPVTTPVYIVGTTNAPAECPNSYFPRQVYDPTGSIIIGTASDAANLISILNGNSAWAVYGTAFNEGNCQVGWYASSQGTTIPNVQVQGGTITTTCMGNTQNYTVQVTDICFPLTTLSIASFPLNIYVDFGNGSGLQFVANVASQAAMIAAPNAASFKPAYITFSAGGVISAISIFNSNCAANPNVVIVKGENGSSNYVLYPGNHTSLLGTTPTKNGVFGIGLRTNVDLGHIPGSDVTKHMWHVIKINNYVVASEGDTGRIYFYDVSNALMPTLARTIQLPDSGVGTCFTGVPNSVQIQGGPSVPSIYGLYFPTDYLGNMGVNNLVVVESVTGSAWLINFSDPGTGITSVFHDARLLGKCPRVVTSGVGIKPSIYFTQDGTLEQAAGLSSGVANGSIVQLALSDFTSSGISTNVLRAGHANGFVWAASSDGNNLIYFTTKDNALVRFNTTSQTVTGTYEGINPTMVGTVNSRLNTTYFNNVLYLSMLDVSGVAGSSIMGVDTTTLGGLIATFQVLEPNGYHAFNVKPLGNCLMVATMYNTSLNKGALVLFKLDGTYLGYITGGPDAPAAETFYNLVYQFGIAVYTPNSFI